MVDVTVSKLNPNSPEFVPASKQNGPMTHPNEPDPLELTPSCTPPMPLCSTKGEMDFVRLNPKFCTERYFFAKNYHYDGNPVKKCEKLKRNEF